MFSKFAGLQVIFSNKNKLLQKYYPRISSIFCNYSFHAASFNDFVHLNVSVALSPEDTPVTQICCRIAKSS